MARWQLMAPHYLNTIPGTEYEYRETNTDTGKQARKVYLVPDYFPEGATVCQGKGERGDVEFAGDPTPDMLPLDDEAEAISNSFRERWAHPIEDIPAQFSDETMKMMSEFAKQIGAQIGAQNVSANQVSAEEFNALKAQLAELQSQLAEKSARRA